MNSLQNQIFKFMRKIKCVVVGDEIAEKTKLLMRYVTNDANEYIPIVSDHFNKEIIVNDQEVDMQLWDTSCQQDYSKLRPLSYQQTDVFILAFALINPFSLDSIESFWLPEIREHCPDAPYILVGTFKNARDDFDNHKEEYKSNGWEPVPTSKGEEVKATILANDYIECDFESKRSIEKVFLRAAKIVLNGGRPDDDDEKKKIF